MAHRAGTVRLALGPGAVGILLAGVALGWLAFSVATAARQVIGWAVAALVVATILEPVVSLAARWMPRALAVVAVFLAVGGAVGSLTFGVLHDLDEQTDRLREAAPQAAAEVEAGEGFLASIADDIDLEERVRRVVAELEEPSSGVAAGARRAPGARRRRPAGATTTAGTL
jgi:predicted PurR-regulated permease PerM